MKKVKQKIVKKEGHKSRICCLIISKMSEQRKENQNKQGKNVGGGEGGMDGHRMGHTGYLLLCSYLANSGVSVKPAKILEPIINQLNFILQ